MDEFIEGLIVLIFLLSIVGLFIINWWRDYKRTGKIFVLRNSKIKNWKPLVFVLVSMFSIFDATPAMYFAEDYYNSPTPIQINPEQYNPWGWYL